MIFTGLNNSQSAFVTSCIEESLVCGQGGHVLKNPYLITRCQHSFCRKCLKDELQNVELLSCPKCLIRINKDEIVFSTRDNTRLMLLWKAVYGQRMLNPFSINQGQDIESIFTSRCN